MTKPVLYHNPRCSKSRDAATLLQANNMEYEERLYLKDVPTEDELRELIDLLGIRPYDLVRQSEDVFQKKFSKRHPTRFNWIREMVKHPELIQRPIFIHKKRAVIGRPPEKVLDLL
ncbi:MAG: arsenate reductase family protein [Flavobacteriales bacterium]|nr:arsenate reductase family protein [Bacteroidota bacterium]MCB9240662.1 arsenate reductase family protein [Flavobacteriales bacterium]